MYLSGCSKLFVANISKLYIKKFVKIETVASVMPPNHVNSCTLRIAKLITANRRGGAPIKHKSKNKTKNRQNPMEPIINVCIARSVGKEENK